MDETLTTLAGTVAGLGSMVEFLFQNDSNTQARLDKVESRLDALERREPPAA